MTRLFTLSIEYDNNCYTAIVVEGQKRQNKSYFKVSVYDEEMQYQMHKKEIALDILGGMQKIEQLQSAVDGLTHCVSKAIYNHVNRLADY